MATQASPSAPASAQPAVSLAGPAGARSANWHARLNATREAAADLPGLLHEIALLVVTETRADLVAWSDEGSESVVQPLIPKMALQEAFSDWCGEAARQAGEAQRGLLAGNARAGAAILAVAPLPCFPELRLMAMYGRTPERAELALELLQAAASHISLWRLDQERVADRDQSRATAAVVELISGLQSETSLTSACELLVEQLERYLDCADVAVGVCREHDPLNCQVAARTSGEIGSPSDSLRLCEAALRESLARSEPALWPAQDAGRSHALLAHEQFAREHAMGAVASWTLRDDSGHVTGAILVGWREDTPPRLDESRRFVNALAIPLASCVRQRQRCEQNPLARWFRITAHRVRSRAGLATLAVVAGLAGLMWVPLPHRVACDCQLEPVLRRYVAAPFDGQLRESHVEAGDTVEVGELLAELDGRELRWEASSAKAELHRAQKERAGHLAMHDVGKAQIAEQEAERLELKIQLLEHRLQALAVTAPLAGVVVSGDLERAQGMPVEVGQVLFEIAPLDRMVIEVAIPEHEAAQIREGMPVQIALEAFPDRRWTSRIRRVQPRSELRDQKNVFIAEALLDAEVQLRPGMRGTARISADSKPLGWILFHRAWASLLIWLGV